MDLSTALQASLGGVLIGLSATVLLLFNGRIAGISGIAAELLFAKPGHSELPWRAAFVAGLVVGGAALALLWPEAFAVTHGRPLAAIVIAGLVVGFGVRLGNGCTSGHGVCGTSRFSNRSVVATLTFIATGAVTVALYRALGGVS